MSIFAIASIVARFLGLIPLADKLWQRHEAVAKTNQQASAPTTDQEFKDAADKGQL